MKPGTHILTNGMVEIMIPLAPITKKNSQQICWKNTAAGKKIPFIRPSAQFTKYEKECLPLLKSLQIEHPVNVEAHFYMPTRRAVDLTNLNEALHDILVKGQVLVDDNAKIIVSTDGSRVHLDRENPRTEVKITEVEATFAS